MSLSLALRMSCADPLWCSKTCLEFLLCCWLLWKVTGVFPCMCISTMQTLVQNITALCLLQGNVCSLSSAMPGLLFMTPLDHLQLNLPLLRLLFRLAVSGFLSNDVLSAMDTSFVDVALPMPRNDLPLVSLLLQKLLSPRLWGTASSLWLPWHRGCLLKVCRRKPSREAWALEKTRSGSCSICVWKFLTIVLCDVALKPANSRSPRAC